MTVNDLPSLNASLNAVSALWLTAGYVFIRQRRVAAHRFCMVGAFVTSTAFLTAYVVYHLQVGSKHFVGPPLVHGVYLAILASHTLLAIPLTVLAVVTLFRALRACKGISGACEDVDVEPRSGARRSEHRSRTRSSTSRSGDDERPEIGRQTRRSVSSIPLQALSSQFERHRAIARFTLPIWWYVSVTGVVVYFMLYHL